MAQTEPRLGDPDRNVETCLARLEEAAAAGCALVLLPECATSGYMFASEDEAARFAEEIPGPAVEALAGACARHGLHCVAGVLERDGDSLRNTAVLVGPDGLLGRYRKSHLPFLGVDRFVTPGDEPPEVYDTPVGRLGIVICYELRFPEPSRTLALGGAELVLHPTNWPAAVRPLADFLTRARAAENRVFLVTANRVGTERGVEFFGRSQVVDPLGDRLVEAGDREERLLLAEIEPAEAREKDRVLVPGEYELHLFGDRRPELYGALVEETRPVHVP
ncbi:MAG TPA: carbon-nitrogen hydrolase family protein [Gaiellaceae bacterium]|nr:carbon-nitrogen hydrolase family protein [Gaiellaceae bacterium]